jgi:hypothetical protein
MDLNIHKSCKLSAPEMYLNIWLKDNLKENLDYILVNKSIW